MSTRSRWLLPDGVDEQLPPTAAQLEMLRRRALDLFATWGYQLCMPPLVEFLDSLLSGLGEDLELQTFKLTDQMSGRMLGIPADLTPQIARIDAHRMPTENPQRLCYLAPILHTRPDKFAGSRNPIQVGAELYGHAGIDSDAEVVCLMLELLEEVGITDVTLELGHLGIFRGLVAAAALAPDAEAELLDGLLRKARSEVDFVLANARVPSALGGMLRALLTLNGGVEVLTEAARALGNAPSPVPGAVAALNALVESVLQRRPGTDIHLDLAELRGYRYHTGVLFAAYTPELGRAVAWGGRYDNVGGHFGRARPATGFSTELKLLASLSRVAPLATVAIYAPAGADAGLLEAIRSLRARGEIVVQALPGQQGDAVAMGCHRVLVQEGAGWRVVSL